MLCWNDIERLLDNQSFAAFLGAFLAFMLVVLTDRRRSRRKARNLTLEIESVRLHATRKRDSVIAIRDDMRKHNKLRPGRLISFDVARIHRLASEVLDQLSLDQRRSIDAITFRMEGCDQLLEEAHQLGRLLGDPAFHEGRIAKADELQTRLGEVIVNLGVLVYFCESFANGSYAKILLEDLDLKQFEVA